MTDALAPTADVLREVVEALAPLRRNPGSEGEREAAEWIARRLGEAGAAARIEAEEVGSTFYLPIGVHSALGAAAGVASLLGARRLGALAGATVAAGLWEDLTGGSRRPLRRLLPKATVRNVVAEAGDRDAARTLVLVAHHDAARTSFIFDETLPRALIDHLPVVVDRLDRWPPLMGLVFLGPALVAAGSLAGRRGMVAMGTAMSAASAAVMADMGTNEVVPGANDNLSAVAVLVRIAEALRDEPVKNVRVLLVSTGAEEANQEGMLAFARRHFAELPKETTTFLALEMLGSGELVVVEGEGFLRMYDYPEPFRDELAAAGADAGVHVRRGLRTTYASDALIPRRAGYQCGMLCSVNEYLLPREYHKPTDTPDRLDWDCVADGARLVEALVRRFG
ncbi:MAG: M28 family peptidase [Solirubrobacteraceae bacterium]